MSNPSPSLTLSTNFNNFVTNLVEDSLQMTATTDVRLVMTLGLQSQVTNDALLFAVRDARPWPDDVCLEYSRGRQQASYTSGVHTRHFLRPRVIEGRVCRRFFFLLNPTRPLVDVLVLVPSQL
jgi:hypothetical protein